MLEPLGILAKVGAVAALGWWIDLALDDSQHKRVRRKLDDWWTKFDQIKWFNFGQREGQQAIELFDRTFGRRFWSWRRLGGVCMIIGVALVLATPLVFVLHVQREVTTTPWAPLLLPIGIIAMSMPVHAITMALSLSATRWLTAKVVHLTGAASIIGFLGLLLFALFLLAFWVPTFSGAKAFVSFIDSGWTWSDYVGTLHGRLLRGEYFASLPNIIGSAESLAGRGPVGLTIATVLVATHLADYFVSTVRVLFAAFFLGCFVLRRFVHRPLSQLGFIWLTSGKPVFATLFGAIAAVIVAVHELSKSA